MLLAYVKTKMQISCIVMVHLIITFFRYIDSTSPLPPKSKISSLWPSSVVVQPGYSDLVGNPKGFSHDMAHTMNVAIFAKRET